MKTTVRNMMMSFVLVGGLLCAAPASAQMSSSRQRSATNGATMNNNRERPSAAMSGSSSRQSVSTQRPDNNRSGGGSSMRPENNRNNGNTGRSGNSAGNLRPDNNRNGNTGRSGNSGGNMRPDNNRNNGSTGRSGNSAGNLRPDNNRPRPNGNVRSDDRGRRPGGNVAPRPYNYNNHPHRDVFRDNYARHNWSRPLPPPARRWRPAPLRIYRPVVPVHYRPYYGAPVIDRILGLAFGTIFDVSLDYLYSNGYYIDGYANDVVYLRDVSMLNLMWPDVMLCYDGGRLMNAQFAYSTAYNDRSRYNRIYHDLSAVYGPPVSVEAGMATWFGGNTTGYVTLSLGSDRGRFYTTLSVGY
ncbi:MAG: hypothetical protein IJ808_06550 [Muribaculaceae bacterium]|nr:hypothetical protein [Muribaculaceae bacterium]